MNIQKTIKELIQFYVQTNYNKYLKDNNITLIPKNEIHYIVNKFYDGEERRNHIKMFVLNGIKTFAEKSGEQLNYNNIEKLLNDILEDQELGKTRVIQEIIIYQNHKSNLISS